MGVSGTIVSLLAPAGIPGNDDQGAMATVLSFHLLGLYPGKVEIPLGRPSRHIYYALYSPVIDPTARPLPIHPKIYHSQLIPERQHYRDDSQL